MSPTKWIQGTNAIGIVAKSGRYMGTYAHKDIAFEFASWVSVEFKLYLIKEFQRLKEQELKQLGWDIRRNLTKNKLQNPYRCNKENLIPKELNSSQINFVYTNWSRYFKCCTIWNDCKKWREQNKDEKRNIRDTANVKELVCLANMESLNAHFINEGLSQKDGLQKS